MKTFSALLTLFLGLLLVDAVDASYPCGIYARIDRVELLGDPMKPSQVKIYGDFILVKTSGRVIEEAERGYMWFSLVKSKEEHCRIEWNDLKTIAQTTQYVAFGSQYSEIRDDLAKDGNAPNVNSDKPIPYPLNHGLTRLRTNRDARASNNPVVILKKFLAKNPLKSR